ncbi:hypothetical protein F4V43_01815 [Paenibacillus spiritus]|uniref:Uncharacterized protein n=1 Tax=Paenibacillus spiritus TaxID=2496557 RepID=A0A5J5GHR9_9BACL|nr:hypothetical protein [Paenibacillus spiritus]KAA9007248.1 hypothetical protein F4V43_01815 [Paenibacillus spiritus]
MIFWTLVFFVINLLGLLGRSMFYETNKRLELLSIDKAQEKIDDEKLNEEFIKNGCLQWIVAVALAVAEVIYLINAIRYDVYKVPTLGAIIFLVLSFVVVSFKKNINKMNENELILRRAIVENSKRITLFSVVSGLVWTTYFGYMFYILVF